MILCSCNRLTCREVKSAALSAADADPSGAVSPGQVFRMTGCRIRCGQCGPLVNRTIAAQVGTSRGQNCQLQEGV